MKKLMIKIALISYIPITVIVLLAQFECIIHHGIWTNYLFTNTVHCGDILPKNVKIVYSASKRLYSIQMVDGGGTQYMQSYKYGSTIWTYYEIGNYAEFYDSCRAKSYYYYMVGTPDDFK